MNDRPLPLFDVQTANLNRVRSKIGLAVIAFVKQRLADHQPEFVISELHEYVTRAHGGAPASPDRILRDGRQKGWFDYEVVSRSQSKYRILSVK